MISYRLLKQNNVLLHFIKAKDFHSLSLKMVGLTLFQLLNSYHYDTFYSVPYNYYNIELLPLSHILRVRRNEENTPIPCSPYFILIHLRILALRFGIKPAQKALFLNKERKKTIIGLNIELKNPLR